MDGFPWTTILCCSVWDCNHFSTEWFPSYIKNQKISAQLHGVFHFLSEFVMYSMIYRNYQADESFLVFKKAVRAPEEKSGIFEVLSSDLYLCGARGKWLSKNLLDFSRARTIMSSLTTSLRVSSCFRILTTASLLVVLQEKTARGFHLL